MENKHLEGIFKVSELIEALKKLDTSRFILIGNSDKNGRNDMNIRSIIRKSQGSDNDNDFYYVLSFGSVREGCIKC